MVLSEDPARTKGSILVIRGGAIGDFILTLPVFRALREAFPDTRIEALAYPKIAKLGEISGTLDATRPIEARPLAGFFARRGALDAGFRTYFSRFSIIVSYLYDPDEFFQNNVRSCSDAQFILGPFRPDESSDTHATDALLEPLNALAVFNADAAPQIPVSPNLEWRQPQERWLAIHPGSGSERKNWPEARWAEALTRWKEALSCNFLIVGGEAEGDRLDTLATVLPPDRVQVKKSLPLDQLASVLASCDGFVGHDSGISHLAAAVGARGVVLWGETNDKVWRPRSDAFHVLKAVEGLDHLSFEEVDAAVSARLGDRLRP